MRSRVVLIVVVSAFLFASDCQAQTRFQICLPECQVTVPVLEQTCRVIKGPNNCDCGSNDDTDNTELKRLQGSASIRCRHGCTINNEWVPPHLNEEWLRKRDPTVYPHEGKHCGNICNHECKETVAELEQTCRVIKGSNNCNCLSEPSSSSGLRRREADARIRCRHGCTINNEWLPPHLNEEWLRTRDPTVYPHEGKFCGNICNHECRQSIPQLEQFCRRSTHRCDCSSDDVTDASLIERERRARLQCERSCTITNKYVPENLNEWWLHIRSRAVYPREGRYCGNVCLEECRSSIWQLENRCKIRRGINNCNCLKDIADKRLQRKELKARNLCDRGCNVHREYIKRADNEWWNRKRRFDKYPAKGKKCR